MSSNRLPLSKLHEKANAIIENLPDEEQAFIRDIRHASGGPFGVGLDFDELSQEPPVFYLKIMIDPNQLTAKDEPLLQKLFAHLLTHSDSTLPFITKLTFSHPGGNADLAQAIFSSILSAEEPLRKLVNNNVLMNPVILSGLLSALRIDNNNHIPYQIVQAMIAGHIANTNSLIGKIPYQTLAQICQLIELTPLDLCHDWHGEKNILDIIKLSDNINYHDKNDGNTALHFAARFGDHLKARLLLMHGADPTIKNKRGETFWDVPSRESSLNKYRLYNKMGHTLKLPPEIIKQSGINCGFYAVACAAKFHYHHTPTLFKQAPLPAKKRDTEPKAHTSLRQKRHELGIKGEGYVFSVMELQKIIEKTECESFVYDIADFAQFMDVIKKAIELNLPVIIPFSSSKVKSGYPDIEAKSSSAHWATVIGWGEKDTQTGILLAQYGTYFDVDANDLFSSFYNMQPTFPPTELAKVKNKGWVKKDMAGNNPADVLQTSAIPLTSLDNFRRKLVLVLPPHFDKNLLDVDPEKKVGSQPD